MKKLMIAAAIVCAAAFSQAATGKWTSTNLYVPGADPETKAAGYMMYFIESSAYDLSSATSDLKAGKLDFLSNAKEGASYVSKSGAGSIQGWGDYGNDETITGYLVVINASEVKDATLAYITKEASGTTGSEGQQANIAFGKLDGSGSYGADSRVTSNWYAVPEPTSGLLLLLGVAGLALKRKRA